MAPNRSLASLRAFCVRPYPSPTWAGSEQLWRRLRKEVGPGLFVYVLEDAANTMLTDIELGKVRTARLFDAEGKLTKRDAAYLEDALCMVINPEHNHFYGEDLFHELEAVFDMDTFAYFKAERKVKNWH